MIEEKTTLITPEQIADDSGQFDMTLRPKTLGEYIGQENVKANLIISIGAAKKRSEPIEHILLYGPPGLGKTTLANIVAREMGVNIKTTSGPAIEKPGDLASILSNLEKNDILFIDEIHRLKTQIEEILYSAMEDFALDLMIGKGPAARSMRLSLPPFTLIGATTKAGSLSSPLRDRFGHIYKLDFYEPQEIGQIIGRSASILEITIQPEGIRVLEEASRRTPRIANRLLKRIRDYAAMKDEPIITGPMVKKGLEALGVDPIGLDRTDRHILCTIIEKFKGGPVGLNTLAAATAEECETIEDLYEPYLMQIGFLDRTSRGRMVTPNAYDHLGIDYVKSEQNAHLF